MTRTAEQIVALHTHRRSSQAKTLQTGELLRRVYNGEHIIPLPELERSERNQVANIIQTGIDAHAQRVASVLPVLRFPPVKQSKAAQKLADDRRQTVQAWWYKNRVPAKLRRRARHLIGFGTSPVLIRPGPDGYPKWEIREPLTTFPAPSDPDDLIPSDCIFAFRRSKQYLKDNYDITRLPWDQERRDMYGRPTVTDPMVDVLQYIDKDEYVMVAVGTADDDGRVRCLELSRVTNQTGEPCVIVPGRTTMTGMAGQFDQLIGMYESQGLLWSMHIHALKRAIFPEVWLEGPEGGNPQIIAEADPYQGDVGVVVGGKLVPFRADPSIQTLQTMDRIERNERISGSVPAEFGGEAASNIRTARRGGQVLSAAVDFPIQEHQELLAASLEAENRVAIATAKAYWPRTTRTFQIPWGDGNVTYTPETTFETDMHSVTYAYAGTDTNALVVEGGQRVAMGAMSVQSFQEIDPLIQDPVFEHQRIVAEGVEKAHMSAIQQQAAQPDGPYQPIDLARLSRFLIEDGMTLYEAEEKLQKEIQARQAQAAQGQLSPEQMQPGNAQPGAPGTPQAAAAIEGPQPSQDNLAMLMQSLRGPRRPMPGQGQPAPQTAVGR